MSRVDLKDLGNILESWTSLFKNERETKILS